MSSDPSGTVDKELAARNLVTLLIIYNQLEVKMPGPAFWYIA